MEEACSEKSSTAVELLPILFKRKLDGDQLGLAVGECIAHLNYLHQRGRLSREIDSDDHYRYTSVDDTLVLRLRREKYDAAADAPIQV